MDLHPSQNAFQGLACLGSRKKESFPASLFLGRMKVNADGSCWEWEQDHQNQGNNKLEILEASTDSMHSAASTRDNPKDRNSMLLPLKARINIWLEASVIMPSPICVGAHVKVSSLLQSCPQDRKTASGSKRALSTSPMSLEMKQPIQNNQESKKQQLWRELLFDSLGLKWFRDALGGKDETKKLFSQAYTNIQNISKPKEVSEAANASNNNKDKKGVCPPWALVHLSDSDACMCSLRLTQVT